MSITIIYGCMFAGKTTELLRYIKKSSNFIVFKPSIDTRSSNCIKSHNGKTYPAINFSTIDELYSQINDVKNIFIDEGQFVENLINFCLDVRLMDKNVYVAGLNYTFDKKPFGDILKLVEIADTRVSLFAKCQCGKPASFTARTSKDTKKIIIGSDIYLPVCSKCFTS